VVKELVTGAVTITAPKDPQRAAFLVATGYRARRVSRSRYVPEQVLTSGSAHTLAQTDPMTCLLPTAPKVGVRRQPASPDAPILVGSFLFRTRCQKVHPEG
jgi:hypothetical protein